MTTHFTRLAVVALLASALHGVGRAQDADAPATAPAPERLLSVDTQYAVLADNPAALLKALEEKVGAEAALDALGAGDEDAGIPGMPGGTAPFALLTATARGLLGFAHGRETVEALTFPVAIGVTGFVPRMFDFTGGAMARADVTFVAEVGEPEAAEALARRIARRFEDAGKSAREVEFRGVEVRCFTEEVTLPPEPDMQFRHGGDGEGEGGGDGGEGGSFAPEPSAHRQDGEPEAPDAPGKPKTRTLTRAILVVEGRCIVAPSEEAAREAILRTRPDGGATSLAELPEFASTFERVGGRAEVRCFVNAQKVKLAAAGEGMNPMAQMFGGMPALRAAASVLRLRESGLVLDEIHWFAAGSSLGMLEMIAPATGRPPEPGFVPGDAVMVGVIRVSWSALWDAMKKMMGPMGGDLEAQAEAQMGMNPHRDFIALLGDTMVMWRGPAGAAGDDPAAGRGPGPQVMVMAVREEAKLRETFRKLAARPQGGVERKDFEGRDLFVMKGGGMGMPLPGMQGMGEGGACCITGGWLVMAGEGEARVREVVARLATPTSPLFADEAWKPLRAALPEHCSVIAFSRRDGDTVEDDGNLAPGADGGLGMLGLSTELGGALITDACERSVQAIVRDTETLRRARAATWAPKKS